LTRLKTILYCFLLCLFLGLAFMPTCSAQEATQQELTRLSEIFQQLEVNSNKLLLTLEKSEKRLLIVEQNLQKSEANLAKAEQQLQATNSLLERANESLNQSKKEVNSLKWQRDGLVAALLLCLIFK